MENKKYLSYANLSAEKLLRELDTSSSGLKDKQAQERIATYGPNAIKETTITWFVILKKQLFNPFLFIFLIIAIVYVLTQQYIEGAIVFSIMVINTCIGFYQEYQSNKAMELLRAYLQAKTLVRRNGKDEEIDITMIVPGDIIILKAGDIVPADCRIIESENLTLNEAPLTGESTPVKKIETVPEKEITSLQDAQTCCFTGTVVVDGSGIGIVFATGINSMLGAIAELTTRTITKSDLSKGTMQLAKIVVVLVVLSLIFILFINFFIKKEPLSFLNMFFFATALAITAIPSALPIIITFCLTQGAMALHKHKIIVKRLSAIEDLGSIEVFCTDKTGTLTENTLQVKDVYALGKDDVLMYAAIVSDISGYTTTSKTFDAAVIQALTPEQKKAVAHYKVLKEIPFTYERYRNILLARSDKEYVMITKGPLEYITPKCSLTKSENEALTQWVHENELEMNRVIAVAIKKSSVHDATPEKKLDDEKTVYDLLGMIAFTDPLKKTASTAIKKAEALGVQVKILSGDSRDVCFTIADQLGLEKKIDHVVLGTDFEKSSEEKKMFLIHHRTIFARIEPEEKYHIIAYLQHKQSVGYMGDGINDAPALKIANVGIAVTDAAPVAREAAEIILLKKSLLNVILGIEEGRKIIINILKYIRITISVNVGTVYSLALSSLFINYLPMLPMQLLFLDLITDFPLIAIASDFVSHQELKKPLQYSMKDISFETFLFGLVSSPFDFIVFALFRSDPATLQTNWFIICAWKQIALIFSLRSKLPVWRAYRPSLLLTSLCCITVLVVTVLPFLSFGQKIFLFKAPQLYDLLILVGITIAYFITTEIIKVVYYQWYGGK